MVFAYLAVGKTFMPTMDEGSVIMQTTKLPSINLAESIATDLRIQKALLEQGARGRERHRARGLRRARARPHEPQRHRRLPGPQAEGSVARARQGMAAAAVARGHGGSARHRVRLHAADRDAHLRDADRRARRSRGQDLRARPQGARRSLRARPDGDRGRPRRRGGVHRLQRHRRLPADRHGPPDRRAARAVRHAHRGRAARACSKAHRPASWPRRSGAPTS